MIDVHVSGSQSMAQSMVPTSIPSPPMAFFLPLCFGLDLLNRVRGHGPFTLNYLGRADLTLLDWDG